MPRTFFVLTHGIDESVSSVSDYALGDFDPTVFWEGRKVRKKIPHDVELYVRRGKRADFLNNPISWLIVSDRLLKVIEPYIENSCQRFEPPLYDETTKKPVSGYTLLNPHRRAAVCTSLAGQKDQAIRDLIVDPSRIPKELHLLRPEESEQLVLVSSDFVDAVRGKRMQDIAFVKLKHE